MLTTTLALLILIPLLIWRIYSRVKRIFVRQESLLWRHTLGATLFPLLLIAAAVSLLPDTFALACLGAGALGGAWLGVFALKKTRMENLGRRFFFKPYDRFGIVLCLLFAARVLHIGVEIYINRQSEVPQPLSQEMVLHHPLSLVPFGLLIAYLAAFSIGMLRWRRAQPALPEVE